MGRTVIRRVLQKMGRALHMLPGEGNPAQDKEAFQVLFQGRFVNGGPDADHGERGEDAFNGDDLGVAEDFGICAEFPAAVVHHEFGAVPALDAHRWGFPLDGAGG